MLKTWASPSREILVDCGDIGWAAIGWFVESSAKK
jgi:hypothetical protein